jgi:hypothetical protein
MDRLLAHTVIPHSNKPTRGIFDYVNDLREISFARL